ncbi:MAG: universal stress protein [Spirochaetota bacterium]
MSEPIERVLVHVDGSEESLTAAEYAILLARRVDAELFVCYVINTRALQDLVRSRIFLETEEREYSRDLEADADRYLNHVRRAADRKGVAVTPIKRSGNVHQELLRVVDEEEIDLLVLGELAHVRSRRDEFYDESERAMRSARCSVLIVKDDERVDDLFQRED